AERADRESALLAAPEIAPARHRFPRGGVAGVCYVPEYQELPCKGAWALGAVRLWSAEKHRACGLARSAIRKHFRRACLNAVRAAHAVSCATGRKSAHRRVVGRSTDRTSEALRTVPTRLCRNGNRVQEITISIRES
ncbi:MAG: hypothetical protein LH632_06085, partial [Rhodoferax sp.]|nr:hypothetical protein [Rhodoferax sp.]